MPPKTKAKTKTAVVTDSSQNQKISTFFKPDISRKRYAKRGFYIHVQYRLLCIFRSHPSDDDPLTSPPPAKRSTDENRAEGCDESHTSPSPAVAAEVSPEQKERMATKKLEAEAKRVAATVGAEKLGLSWVKALLTEFKKPYIKEVRNTLCTQFLQLKI